MLENNKKGFMFIETIVTLTVLTTVLLLLYTTFTNLLNKERIVTAYNKKSYIYALHYIKEYMLNEGYDFELPYRSRTLFINEVVLDTELGTGQGREILENLNALYNLKNLVITDCAFSEYSSSQELSKEFLDFIKSTDRLDSNKVGNNITNNVVKIYGEFYDEIEDKYHYAYIYYPNIEVN